VISLEMTTATRANTPLKRHRTQEQATVQIGLLEVMGKVAQEDSSDVVGVEKRAAIGGLSVMTQIDRNRVQ
jgi:hypothetical protein